MLMPAGGTKLGIPQKPLHPADSRYSGFYRTTSQAAALLLLSATASVTLAKLVKEAEANPSSLTQNDPVSRCSNTVTNTLIPILVFWTAAYSFVGAALVGIMGLIGTKSNQSS